MTWDYAFPAVVRIAIDGLHDDLGCGHKEVFPLKIGSDLDGICITTRKVRGHSHAYDILATI
ncbi:uncharacterized protein SCHCODRAFT_02611349 [Schizophyllum commune H4-8]|uniref:uncharacterized protein n=1 Tax=Schizophyllum commune (strain H4-8 / FGSC 9210) TaxID=578458 RepID=UPI00215E9B7F|nr:uncharacterized protein SCHCODRAFT_02611349 [Schizophyllum commune H4-8]KAI5898189.1 hypothetical protein SCHCODRAFT_02611349 [Schizophyllum commune H4-8]